MRRYEQNNVRPTAALLRVFALLVSGLLVFALGGDARADQAKKPSTLSLVVPAGQSGGRAPIELAARDGGYAGEFLVVNGGTEPITIARLTVRGDDVAPRSPAKITARFADEGASMAVPPKGSRKVVVSWMPEKDSRMKQAFGHVLVATAEEELAMGFQGQISQGPSFFADHILSWLVFLPLAGVFVALAMLLVRTKDDRPLKWFGAFVTFVQCILASWLWLKYNNDVGRLDGNDGFQFIEHGVWVRSLHIEYFVGVDGISISMVLLTAFVGFIGAVVSFGIEKQVKGYWAMYLLLCTGMMGVFVALDLFLFFVFWEVMLLPMYFLIGIWGGPRREYAAIKFFLYTLFGGVLILLSIILLSQNADRTYMVDGTAVSYHFSIPDMMRVQYSAKQLTVFGISMVKFIWVCLFIGFAIKIPMFPFHTWLPDAHVEAPTPVSVILAGILLKMGTYGLLRVNFAILPEATRWAATAMVAFGVVNIVYGAFCAMAQEDLKKLVAYSSVSHMGFCLLGMGALTPQGITGAILTMFSHGIVSAMLFTLVGVVYDRVHTREIGKFGGLAGEMPVYAGLAGLAFMASLGLPGLSGFWGEALTMLGAFPTNRVLVVIAATGIIFGAAYHLWAFARVFFGKFKESWRTNHYLEPHGGIFPDVNFRELVSLVPLAVVCILLGFAPTPLISMIATGVRDATALVNPPGPDQIAHTATGSSVVAARSPASTFVITK